MTERDVIYMASDDDKLDDVLQKITEGTAESFLKSVNPYEVGTKEWRERMAEIAGELSKDTPYVGYINEDGYTVLPQDYRD